VNARLQLRFGRIGPACNLVLVKAFQSTDDEIHGEKLEISSLILIYPYEFKSNNLQMHPNGGLFAGFEDLEKLLPSDGRGTRVWC
jgi:hypothetical protein